MKPKLRIVFKNSVEISPIKIGSLETNEDTIIELKTLQFKIVLLNDRFLSCGKYLHSSQIRARKKKKKFNSIVIVY